MTLQRYKEAKSLLRKTIPIARRVLGEGDDLRLGMRMNYGRALCQADGATLDDLREAVNTLEETERTARRVLGGSHPLVGMKVSYLLTARELLTDRETPSPPSA